MKTQEKALKVSETFRISVLLILTDDQGHWAMGCAGNREMRTPNLDRLAQTGLRFNNFFCASPVCSPARASLLTGRIPSQHGIHDWLRAGNAPSEGALIEYLKGQPGYSDLLAANGYRCGMSGKWHMGDSLHPQKGFSYWRVHATGGGPYYGAPMVRDGEVYQEPRYVTDAITDNALEFLDDAAGREQPFLLEVHYTAPHSPWDRANHPAALYDSYFDHCPFDSTPDLPRHPWQINSAPQGDTPEHRRAVLSGYFAAVTGMDAGVGRILDRLEALGLRERTLVFFCSDNGMNMGHHGIYGKGNGTFPMNMYDSSVKVPAILSLPGRLPQGVVCGDLLSQYDWFPTLLDYLGLENPEAERLPGHSFAPLLRGQALPGRGPVFVLDEYGPVRMIRDERWKYVHRYPYGPHELYDLRNDPDETRNLYGDAGYQHQQRELCAMLEDWFFRYVNSAVDGVREPVTGKGQLGLCGPAAKGARRFADDWHYLTDGGNH